MTYTPKNSKERTLHRLKIVRGHLNKVIAMVENGNYCVDVIHQSQAIQSALKKTDHLILKNHLNSCVVEAIQKGKKDEVISEVMEVFEKSKQ